MELDVVSYLLGVIVTLLMLWAVKSLDQQTTEDVEIRKLLDEIEYVLEQKEKQ